MDHLIDPHSAANRLGVTRRWIYDHLTELPHLRLGRAIRFRPSDLDDWLDGQAVSGPGTRPPRPAS